MCAQMCVFMQMCAHACARACVRAFVQMCMCACGTYQHGGPDVKLLLELSNEDVHIDQVPSIRLLN